MNVHENTSVHEGKLIRLSMITLLLSLLIVYVLLYQIKGEKLQNDNATNTNNYSGIVITTKSGDQTTVLNQYTGQDISGANEDELLGLETKPVTISPIPTALNTGSSSIRMLSGTKLYYGNIDSIEKLGIKYQYALIDDQNMFFINLGIANYDFDSITRALGGSLYKITTEQELAQNKLFGNKVIYINLPEYKEKKVLMLIYIDTQVRLVQMDYTSYHKSKAYLKSLFIE